MRRLFFLGCLVMMQLQLTGMAQTVLVDAGEARCAIFVSERVMAPVEGKVDATSYKKGELPEPRRLRLQDSVADLAACLQAMTGAKVEIVTGAPTAAETRLPILIGELAQAVYGEARTLPGRDRDQTGRLLVGETGVGLWGHSDLATSYAIYELLHELGCRWYMPSEMGEVLPKRATIALAAMDRDLAPYTDFRAIWYADNDYVRRNRMGGIYLSAGHALEGYVPKETLEAHPEWRAQNQNGKTHGRRLKWSKPGVAETIAETLIAKLDEKPETLSISLSPDDGLGFDDTDDRALDAGDFDPSTAMNSTTDRLVWFCNRIISMVEKKHPGIKYGTLAYGPSTRAPVREKLHPDLVPQIAPITFTRAQPMTDDGEPNNAAFRELIKGWGEASPAISYYFYGWFLAEPSAPNPFIEKWSVNTQFVYEHGNCKFWQPETITNFETTMQALYLGLRLAWDPTQDPAAIIAELHQDFYGAAAEEMTAYWHYIDSVWTDVPEYSGCGYGHLRRWTPERMARARALLDAGKAAAETDMEKARITMADESLSLFEQFMALRHDLAEGRFEGLDERADAYYQRAGDLSMTYKPQHAFGHMFHQRKHRTLYASYFKVFYDKTYQDAGRVAAEGTILTPALRDFHYQVETEEAGPTDGWMAPDLDDSAWKTTDTAVDTWSALGLHNFMGAMWYRRDVQLKELPGGKRIYLWIGATDGTARVYVNGKHCPYTNDKGETLDEASGYARPFSFDITDAVKAGTNQVTIRAERVFINELGTGGILSAPVLVYADEPAADAAAE